MGLASVALKLTKKGFKPLINEAEKTLTYITKQGIQKQLLFDSRDKVKFWQSLDIQSGKMKVFENLENNANKRISKVINFSSYKPVETKTISTDIQAVRQTVTTENHITGQISTKSNKAAKTSNSKIHTNSENGKLNIRPKPAITASKQEKFEWQIDTAEEYLKKRMTALDSALLDKNGKIGNGMGQERYSFEELIKPYNGDMKEFYHATTPESKNSILKEGFNQRKANKHGALNGIGGTYFALSEDTARNLYGSAVIKARFKGKIAQINPNLLNDIKTSWCNRSAIDKMLEKDGITDDILGETIMGKYLQQKVKSMGYSGVITSEWSWAADCNYFSALEPKLIEIIN